jgi:predicted dehydrogenase
MIRKKIINISNWRNPVSESRVLIEEVFCEIPIHDQYIVHQKSFWLLWNYIRRIGFNAVITKIISRFSEVTRNQKFAGIGLGRIVENSINSSLDIGQRIIYFSPNYNRFCDDLVLNDAFIYPLFISDSGTFNREVQFPEELKIYIAWSPYSGLQLDVDLIQKNLAAIPINIKNFQSKSHYSFKEPITRIEFSNNNTSKLSAVLFGLGNYAKTAILPNIKKHVALKRIHEIDPLQLKYAERFRDVSMDSSPFPCPSLEFDIWFIAGFHHHHTSLAVQAISSGATAVIEKPLATKMSDYLEFKSTVEKNSSSRFFLCFHKRYSKLNDFLLLDRGKDSQLDPVDMHCIVYEIPLPRHHWYNWKNSGSRLISNGCHWLDYFMFLNNYSEVSDLKKWTPRGTDVVVQVKLTNGAYLSMTLTDTGSQRLGVRDYIELRSMGNTYTMIDSEFYRFESRSRIHRKERVNPMHAYSRMYKNISKKIQMGYSGDSIISLNSSLLTLLLEEM